MVEQQMTDELMKRRADIFCKKQIPVHITKKDLGWLNGFIKEVGADFIILNEFKLGEMPVFFLEIKNIETFTKEVGG